MAQLPPLPPQPYRDDDALSTSELMPFRSKKISLWKSRALIPLIATALTCVLLFTIKGSIQSGDDVYRYMYVLSTFLVFAIFAGIYFYVGERKNMLWYLVPAAITFFQLAYLLTPYFYVFRTLLPGDIKATGFVSAFIGMFFGAGLMEELLKAVPMLLALAIALHLRKTGQPGNRIVRGLALQGPVDGLLMGCAAGAAFILAETLWQYVPNEVMSTMRRAQNNAGMGFLSGFLLLLPRVLNGVIGHMAWAGIFGYFIGLAVSHPRSLWKLLAIGWLLPSVLHGFWNSSYWLLGSAGFYLSALLTAFFFLACILKAKQLEVSRLGTPISGHSILAFSPPPATTPPGPAGVVPPAPAGIAAAFTGLATAVEKLFGFTARTTVPNPGAAPAPAAPSAPAAVPASGISIGSGTTRYALAPNQTIDFSALFGAAGVPAGYSGLITGTADSMELRNTGTETWTASTPDGASASVPPGSTLKAAAGTRLILGPGSVDMQAF